jgi:hypothetical protein
LSPPCADEWCIEVLGGNLDGRAIPERHVPAPPNAMHFKALRRDRNLS